jgi:hypothetical protein
MTHAWQDRKILAFLAILQRLPDVWHEEKAAADDSAQRLSCPMPVSSGRWHEGRKAIQKLVRREVDHALRIGRRRVECSGCRCGVQGRAGDEKDAGCCP